MPASYGRRIGWAITACMAKHCNFTPAIMTEGLMEHPATNMDSRIDNDKDIAIYLDNGTPGRVAGSDILLQVFNGEHVSLHSDGESLES